jgi:FkbM family methyltransferase
MHSARLPTKTLQIHDLQLLVLEENKSDAGWYLQRQAFEERHSFLYTLLQREGYGAFIDVGANYGFISMLARLALPRARILSIEADPRIAALIGQYFQLNRLNLPEVLNVIAGERVSANSTFCLNPHSSLDNRVSIPGWKAVSVPTFSVGTLLDERAIVGPVFIKIDTQGYEPRVLAGLAAWLASRSDWLIKMEFAPYWLQSQGHDPLDLLEYLTDLYEITEYPERLRYNTQTLNGLFDKLIQPKQLPDFCQHVVSLNQNQRGWVDLMVRSKFH